MPFRLKLYCLLICCCLIPVFLWSIFVPWFFCTSLIWDKDIYNDRSHSATGIVCRCKKHLYLIREWLWVLDVVNPMSCSKLMPITHWGWDKNGCHFTNNSFKSIFLNENVWILIKISLRFVSKGPIVPFHKDFSTSGEQLGHRKLAHGL